MFLGPIYTTWMLKEKARANGNSAPEQLKRLIIYRNRLRQGRQPCPSSPILRFMARLGLNPKGLLPPYRLKAQKNSMAPAAPVTVASALTPSLSNRRQPLVWTVLVPQVWNG